MDLAKTLVRSCARAFYSDPGRFDIRHILIIDALAVHSALRDDDLAYLMSMTTKDLHKYCATLRDDRFLAVHFRAEVKENSNRPANRTYYYIDYRQSIDAIKWRVYKLGKDMQVPSIPADERKDYVCKFCGNEYTTFEILDAPHDQIGIKCHQCDHYLTYDQNRLSAGHDKVTKLNNQLSFITGLLRQIDAVLVPDNNFEAAFQNTLPVVRDAQHQVVRSTVVDTLKPTSVKGMVDTGPKKIDVNISTSDGPTEEEKEAERTRKEKRQKENALPTWFLKGVDGNNHSKEATASTTMPKIEAGIKASKPSDSNAGNYDHLDMERVAREIREEEAAAEAAKKLAEEEEGSDDDEEDDFEDVPATAGLSAGGTPASSTPALGTLPTVPSPLRQSSMPLKREASPNGDSAVKGDTADADDRPAKKVKVEEPAADDEEDDFEFEDV